MAFLLYCGVNVTSVRSVAVVWRTLDFGEMGLLADCRAECDSDGDNDVFCTPSDVLPCNCFFFLFSFEFENRKTN